MINSILDKIGFLTTILKHAAALALFFGLMLLTTIDVIGRYLFDTPIMGVFEITEFMLVTFVFFSLAYTQSVKGHVAVDIVVNLFPKKLQTIIDVVNYLISFLVLTLIAWMSFIRGFEVLESKDYSGTLSIPVFPFVFLVAIGSTAMSIELLKDFIKRSLEVGKS